MALIKHHELDAEPIELADGLGWYRVPSAAASSISLNTCPAMLHREQWQRSAGLAGDSSTRPPRETVLDDVLVVV